LFRVEWGGRAGVAGNPVDRNMGQKAIPVNFRNNCSVFSASRGLDFIDYSPYLITIENSRVTTMAQKMYESVTDKNLWKRIISMLVLGFAYGIARVVLGAVVVFQVLFTLFTGNNNEPLKAIGKNLTNYIYEILMFLTFNSEDRPFPFRGWSESGSNEDFLPPGYSK
jgi:hypothetical protein